MTPLHDLAARAGGPETLRGVGDVLDLFSAAAGGWSLGMHRAGFTTVAACEVEAWRRALYAENNPHVRLYDDVRTLTADRLLADLGRLPSIVVGSPPCQDISSANTKGRGVEGERSGLYFEAIRIIGEVRPRWFALENSANLRTRGADAVVAALEALGYACWPCVVRAGDIDANHERPRAWLLGCDLEQVANADGLGRDEGWSGRRLGFDMAAAPDPRNAHGQSGPAGIGAATLEGANAFGPGRLRPDPEYGRGGPLHAADAARIGCIARSGTDEGGNSGRDGRVTGDDDGGCDAAYADSDAVRVAIVSRGSEPKAPIARDTHRGQDAPDPDQARQAHGRVEPGVRSAQVADDGRGAGWGADGACAGQVGVCSSDCDPADRSGPEWSLEHLADHLRLDDGLSAWLAGTRVQVGDGKGQSAASLTVEAFGDAVIPQIPEAIGRAILRTEAALTLIYGLRSAA